MEKLYIQWTVIGHESHQPSRISKAIIKHCLLTVKYHSLISNNQESQLKKTWFPNSTFFVYEESQAFPLLESKHLLAVENIFDDNMKKLNHRLNYAQELSTIACTCFHEQVALVTLRRKLKDNPPALRANESYVFFTGKFTKQELFDIYVEYARGLSVLAITTKFNKFAQCFRECLDQHGVVFLDASKMIHKFQTFNIDNFSPGEDIWIC